MVPAHPNPPPVEIKTGFRYNSFGQRNLANALCNLAVPLFERGSCYGKAPLGFYAFMSPH